MPERLECSGQSPQNEIFREWFVARVEKKRAVIEAVDMPAREFLECFKHFGFSRKPQNGIRVERREGKPERHVGLGNLVKTLTHKRAGERLPLNAPLTPRL